MDRNYELFRIATSAVREMNVRRERVMAAQGPSFVAYHAAELAEHANKAQIAQEMLRTVLAPMGDLPELYEDAWEFMLLGDSDSLIHLFIEDAKKES